MISADLETASFFEKASKNRDPKTVANWIITNLFGKLNESNLNISQSPISADSLGKLIDIVDDGTISHRIAKDVFEEMFVSSLSASEIVDKKGLKQISNQDEIEKMVETIITDNPMQKKQYLEGNEKVLGWFVGQVMKISRGKANPSVVNSIIKSKLKNVL